MVPKCLLLWLKWFCLIPWVLFISPNTLNEPFWHVSVITDKLNTVNLEYFAIIAEMVFSIVFVIETKIVNSSAPNPEFYSNKRTQEALYTIWFTVQVKVNDKSVLCQVKHIIYVGFYLFLRSVVVILGIFHFFLYNSHWIMHWSLFS